MTFKNDFNFEQMQYSISVLYLKYLIYSYHFFVQSYTIESIRDLSSMNGIKSCHEKL